MYSRIDAWQQLGKNPFIVARLGLVKNVTAPTNIRNNRRTVSHVVFYAVCVVSRNVGDQFFPELLVI
jgi:hypothetical protein